MRFVRPEALKNHDWEMASHSQPAFAKHFNFRYVAGLINECICKICGRVRLRRKPISAR
jgi:hypothetical protein